MILPSSRSARRAAERAAAKVKAVERDPIAVAAELEEANRTLRLAFGMLHVAVRRLQAVEGADHVRMIREEYQSLPPAERLDVTPDTNGNVVLKVGPRE